MLAAGLNFVAIVTWCFMNPNRTSDKKLSPEAIRTRFIAILTSLVLLTLGTISYNIYKSTRKKPAPSTEAKEADPNNVGDNQIIMEEDR